MEHWSYLREPLTQPPSRPHHLTTERRQNTTLCGFSSTSTYMYLTAMHQTFPFPSFSLSAAAYVFPTSVQAESDFSVAGAFAIFSIEEAALYCVINMLHGNAFIKLCTRLTSLERTKRVIGEWSDTAAAAPTRVGRSPASSGGMLGTIFGNKQPLPAVDELKTRHPSRIKDGSASKIALCSPSNVIAINGQSDDFPCHYNFLGILN